MSMYVNMNAIMNKCDCDKEITRTCSYCHCSFQDTKRWHECVFHGLTTRLLGIRIKQGARPWGHLCDVCSDIYTQEFKSFDDGYPLVKKPCQKLN